MGPRLPIVPSTTSTIDVYTDGACSGNPGPGGWAWVTRGGAGGSGSEPDTTNQRMEVRAVLEALRENPGPVHIYSDSAYVVNCFNDRWYEGWLKRGWKNSQKKPVANRDLWEPLLEEALPRIENGDLKFFWVKGHSGDEMNDRADALAVAALEQHKESLGPAESRSRSAEELAIESALESAPGVPWDFTDALVVVGATSLSADQERAVKEAIRSASGLVVSGLRRGAELVAAEAALDQRLKLAAVLPFPDPAAHWPEDLRSRFDTALGRADFEIVLNGDPASPGSAMRLRNRWLENAALGIVVVGDPALAARFDDAGLSVIEIP
ncbi:MAG: hypothetical protein HKN03_09815 [Acidimicrobiales bacterium]|nr:hypothetical protein [Acidimicrobiales bacterium]